MAKKKNTIPSGFDDILGNIYSNSESMEEVTKIDDQFGYTELTLDDEEDKKEPPVEKTEDGNKEDDTQKDSHEDDSEIPEDIINNNNKTEETEVEDTELEDKTEPSEDDVIEAQQVGLLFDAVGQQLGWNMADIDEKDRPLTVEDLTNYWAETIKENSVPQYADDRI